MINPQNRNLSELNTCFFSSFDRLPHRVSHINFNLYHYAGNNPVKYFDPDGREAYDSSITREQFEDISQGIRQTSNGYEVTVGRKTWNEAQQFFAENPNGVIYRNPDEVCYRFYTNKGKDSPQEYQMLTTTGVDLLLFGRGIYKAVGAGIAANTATKVETTLSKNLTKHILNHHTLSGLRNQSTYRPLEELIKKTVFNPSWSNDKVIRASQVAIERGIKKGVTNGEFVTKVFGETVTVFFANGKIDSVYGAITVTREMLLN